MAYGDNSTFVKHDATSMYKVSDDAKKYFLTNWWSRDRCNTCSWVTSGYGGLWMLFTENPRVGGSIPLLATKWPTINQMRHSRVMFL